MVDTPLACGRVDNSLHGSILLTQSNLVLMYEVIDHPVMSKQHSLWGLILRLAQPVGLGVISH